MKCEQVAQVSFSSFIFIISFQCIVETTGTTAYPLSVLVQVVVITISSTFIAIIVVIHVIYLLYRVTLSVMVCSSRSSSGGLH